MKAANELSLVGRRFAGARGCLASDWRVAQDRIKEND